MGGQSLADGLYAILVADDYVREGAASVYGNRETHGWDVLLACPTKSSAVGARA